MGVLLFFLVGFGLAVAGGVTIIAYMNFLPAGISWTEYFLFISTRLECYLLPIGLFFIFISIQRYEKQIDKE